MQPQGDPLPFKIIILDDFSSPIQDMPLEKRPLIRVDRYDFDDVMEKLASSVSISIDDKTEHATFSELDQFDPALLFEELECFFPFRQLQRQLKNPATQDKAIATIRSWTIADTPEPETISNAPIGDTPSDTPMAHSAEPEGFSLADAGLLDSVLNQSTRASVQQQADLQTPKGAVQNLIKSIISSHPSIQKSTDTSEYDAILEDVITETLRAVLHHPELKKIEQAWRSVYWLCKRLRTDKHLQIYILPTRKSELVSDLTTQDDLRDSILYRRLVDGMSTMNGSVPPTLILCAHEITSSQQDVEFLSCLGNVAGHAGAVLLGGINSTFFNAQTPKALAEQRELTLASPQDILWQTYQQLPEAQYTHLSFGNLLLRPAIQHTKIGTFKFNELPSHWLTSDEYINDFCWGNAAYITAYLLAQAFEESHWNMRVGQFNEIEDLPVFVFTHEGEEEAMPCTGTLVTNVNCEALAKFGINCNISVRNTDKVRIHTCFSAAGSNKALAGRWKTS